jgi:asparagine synthase (glutamine-hydrolysing)
MYDLFYACRAGRLLFSPEVKGILADPSFPRQIDLTALAQYMRFQHLLGDRTFLQDIRLLPPGSILTFDQSTGDLSVNAYWSFADLPNRESIHRAEAVEEVGRLLRLAVRSRSEGPLRPGVFLSGGLDSRTILGLIDRRPVTSITFGAPECRDVHLAARIASIVGSNHHWFDLSDSKWIEEWAPLHLTLTEGQHSWIHAHGISALPAARQWMDVELTGWDGGTVMGAPNTVSDLQVHAVDDLAFVNRMYSLFNLKYTWRSFSEAEEALLFREAYRPSLRGRALDSFREEIAPYLRFRPDIRGELFYLRNHCGRLTHNMVTFRRSHQEVRFPFFDYALIDFLYSIPARIRGPRQLYRQVIDREVPRLSRIPYDHDDLPPTYRQPWRGLHSLGVRLRSAVNRNIQPVFRERSLLYADYENYLRRGLRPWAESILFDPKTEARGLFDPQFVRSVMARHQSGLETNTIGKIAPLITYEMMLRQLVD